MILKNRYLFLTAVILCNVYNPAKAEEVFQDNFRLAIGGYDLDRFDSSMSLTDSGVGAGVSINPQDALGWDTKQTVLRLDGHYRFNSENGFIFSWYSITTDSNKVLTQDIQWQDENGNTITIPTGVSVSSSLDYDIYKIGYRWSFYHTDKVELAAGAGLHITRVAVNLKATTTSTGIDANDVNTTVPLPVVTFGVNYHVTPRINWYISSQFFSMAFDDWTGIYTDSELGMEYRFNKNLGLGLGIGSNALKMTQDTGTYKFTFENRITGISIYLAGYF